MAFLQGLQIGANIGNMRVAQQERMMQLRSQAALNAIHERQLAAQADMLAQHAQLYRAQIDKMEDAQKQKTADLAAANDLYHYHTEVGGLDPDEASRNVIGAMTFKNPDLAKEMAGTYETLQKAKTAGQPTQHQQDLLDLGKQRLDLQKQTQTRLEKRETRLDDREKRIASYAPIKEEIRQINGQIQSLTRQRDKIPTDVGALGPGQHGNTISRMQISANIAGLREKVLKLTKQMTDAGVPPEDIEGMGEGEPAAPAAPKLQLKVGSRYRNSEGDERVYRGQDDEGNPIWEESD